MALIALLHLLAGAACQDSFSGAAHRKGHQLSNMPCSHSNTAAARAMEVPRHTQAAARKLLQKKYQLSPDPDNKGCWIYRAVSTDSISAIASALGVSESDLKEANSKNIQDFSRLNGRFLQICNIKNFDNAEGPNGAPLNSASSSNPGPRLSAANPPPAAAATAAPAPASAPAPGPAAAPAQQPAPAQNSAPATNSGPVQVVNGSPVSFGVPILGGGRVISFGHRRK